MNKKINLLLMVFIFMSCVVLATACGNNHKHNLIKVDAVASTCTTEGNILYYKCICGKLFSDAEGKIVIEKNDCIMKAKGHQYKIESKESSSGLQNLGADRYLEENNKLSVACMRDGCDYHTTEENVVYAWKNNGASKYREWQLSNGDKIIEEPVEHWDIVAYTSAVNNLDLSLFDMVGEGGHVGGSAFIPTSNDEKFIYELSTTTSIFMQFEKDYCTLEANIINTKQDIDEYLSSDNDVLNHLKILSQELTTSFYNRLHVSLLEISQHPYPSSEDLKIIMSEFSRFKYHVAQIKDFLLCKVKDKSVNFFITSKDLDVLYNKIKNIYEVLPSDSQLVNFTSTQLIERFNLINNLYDLNEINTQINSLEPISIEENLLNEILDKYYFCNIIETVDESVVSFNHTGKLKEMYDNVVNFYLENPGSADENIKDELNDKISKYYDYIKINIALIKNNLELLRIGSKTDDEIILYNGFSKTPINNLKHNISLGEYYLKYETFVEDGITLFHAGKTNDIKIDESGEIELYLDNFYAGYEKVNISKIYINRGNVKTSFVLTESFDDELYKYDKATNIFYIKCNPQTLGNIMLSFEIEENY